MHLPARALSPGKAVTMTPAMAAKAREYSGDELLDVAIAFIVINVACVVLRTISRSLSKTPRGIDDYLIIPSLFFCVLMAVNGILFVKLVGLGWHVIALGKSTETKLLIGGKLLIMAQFTYLLALTFPKLAILSIYHRVFTLRPYRITVYMIGTVVLLNFCFGFILTGVQCQPFAYNWDMTIPGGRCVINVHKLYQWINLPNLITDLAMLALPVHVIHGLNMSRARKIGLYMTFLTGSVGFVASIVRFVQFSQQNISADSTWNSVILLIWTIVETSTYLIAACLATYRPLLAHLFGSTGVLASTFNRYKLGSTSRATGNSGLAGSGGSSPGSRQLFKKKSPMLSSTFVDAKTESSQFMRLTDMESRGNKEPVMKITIKVAMPDRVADNSKTNGYHASSTTVSSIHGGDRSREVGTANHAGYHPPQRGIAKHTSLDLEYEKSSR